MPPPSPTPSLVPTPTASRTPSRTIPVPTVTPTGSPSGPQRWVVDANWKTAADNFGGDGYHIASTHGSARELGIDTTTSKTRQWNKGCQIACDNGHILVSWLTPPDGGPWFAQPDDQLVDYMKEHESEIEKRLGSKRARQIAPSAGTVFPNLSVHWLTRTIRVWQPRGPDKMEIWSWAIVDKAASPKIKDIMRFVSQYRFSPWGVFEQDDMDNWIQVPAMNKSRRSLTSWGKNGMDWTAWCIRSPSFPSRHWPAITWNR